MSDAVNASLLFLINTLFDLYLFVLIIRLILAYVGSNYYEPITQFIVKITDPVVKPLRRFIPNYRHIEISTILIIIALEMIKFGIISSLTFGFPNLLGLFLLAIGDACKLLIQTFFYAILLQAILSWIQPQAPVNSVLIQFNSPIMRPIQRIIPLVGGVDITPIPALILLQLVSIALINPLMAVALNIAIS
ncbi:MAG: hypothetical protein A3F14_06120 [Gammaproteobacteria bacterium RIFCSPHIGHO2_12_FULL_43_28]|nr:MAG: hypothetical protein A3F14_06120 [Gammaproteobacteria bacterium RIFCSPHIGHO2_12_FULL_43_28]